MPPRRLTLSGGGADGTVPGIIHVHTNRSDGRSSPDEVAAAASRAGLKFLVFTDHGDATRTPDPPTYRSGVLCLDGVEISTNGGHYIALDMGAAPYPLGGEAADVVEDVRRLGGFGIAAHPDSPKPELQWRAWDAPIDAVELLNPDTSWRVWARLAATQSDAHGDRRWYARRRIAFALLDYPFRSPETIAWLMEPVAGERAVDEWAALGARRRVTSIAGIDAHALLALHGDPPENGLSLPLPGYEASFRTLSIHIRTDRPWSGDASADGAAVIQALRNGRFYTAVDGLATPPSFEFTATTGKSVVNEGDEIPAGQPLTLRVRSNAPASFTTTIWNSRTVLSGDHHEAEFSVLAPPDPGMYWVEIRSTGRPSPIAWVRSNPIYVRGPRSDPQPASRSAAKTVQPIVDDPERPAWRVEHDPLSVGAADGTSGPRSSEWRFRFGLAGGAAVGQFVAFVHDLQPGRSGDRITFTTHAERPMRVSVQLRGGNGVVDRWQKSIYVDTLDQERTIWFEECTPVGTTHTPKAPPSSLQSIMIVVDTTNTKPGASGRLWVSNASQQQ